MILEVSNASVEKISYCGFLQSLHCESLTWSSLPIGKYSNYALVENKVENWLDRILVEFIIRLKVGERIIEEELWIVNEFSDAVDSVFAFVHCNDWIWYAHTIDFT